VADGPGVFKSDGTSSDSRNAVTAIQSGVAGSGQGLRVKSANANAPVASFVGAVEAFDVRHNGEYRAPNPRWLNATLGTNVTAGAGSTPGTSREGARVFFRGRPAWTSQTFAAATVLLTVNAEHRPATPKSFSIRTSPDSNISSVLDLGTNGELTNRTSFGTSTTAYLPLDGLNYSLD
jgi:hypothetical protein